MIASLPVRSLFNIRTGSRDMTGNSHQSDYSLPLLTPLDVWFKEVAASQSASLEVVVENGNTFACPPGRCANND
jgi:hypothetical protein